MFFNFDYFSLKVVAFESSLKSIMSEPVLYLGVGATYPLEIRLSPISQGVAGRHHRSHAHAPRPASQP